MATGRTDHRTASRTPTRASYTCAPTAYRPQAARAVASQVTTRPASTYARPKTARRSAPARQQREERVVRQVPAVRLQHGVAVAGAGDAGVPLASHRTSRPCAVRPDQAAAAASASTPTTRTPTTRRTARTAGERSGILARLHRRSRGRRGRDGGSGRDRRPSSRPSRRWAIRASCRGPPSSTFCGTAVSTAAVSCSTTPPTSRPAMRSANQCQFSVSDVITMVSDSSATADHMTRTSVRLTLRYRRAGRPPASRRARCSRCARTGRPSRRRRTTGPPPRAAPGPAAP